MSNVRNGGVGVFLERIHQPVVHFQLLHGGHVLTPDGVARRLDQIHHRRGNAEFEVFGGLSEPVDFADVLGAEALGQRLERCDAPFTEQLLPSLHSSDPW